MTCLRTRGRWVTEPGVTPHFLTPNPNVYFHLKPFLLSFPYTYSLSCVAQLWGIPFPLWSVELCSSLFTQTTVQMVDKLWELPLPIHPFKSCPPQSLWQGRARRPPSASPCIAAASAVVGSALTWSQKSWVWVSPSSLMNSGALYQSLCLSEP